MTRYLEQLNECTDPVTGDFLPIYDASAGATDKDRKVNISRFAVLANAQTFTTTQTIAPVSTSVDAIDLNMPASVSAVAMKVLYNGTQRQQAFTASNDNRFYLLDFDNGASFGSRLIAGRNNNASTPAAGILQLERWNGTAYYHWVDNAGNLRIGTTAPINAQDGSGTVVGAQTSMAEAKNISDVLPNPLESLRHILEAAKMLRPFGYKSGAYNGEQFPIGIVTDLSPRYGMDRDADHPAGKSLNIPVAIGDLIAAVALIAKHLGLEV